MNFEKNLLIAFARVRNKPLNYFFLLFIASGTSVAWFLIAGVLKVLNLDPVFLHCMLSGFISFLLGIVIKKLAHRPRPTEAIPGFLAVYNNSRGDSFPSNHTGAAFALLLALHAQNHIATPYIGIWFFLVALSRLYSGAHYPSDVLGGMGLGFIAFKIAALF